MILSLYIFDRMNFNTFSLQIVEELAEILEFFLEFFAFVVVFEEIEMSRFTSVDESLCIFSALLLHGPSLVTIKVDLSSSSSMTFGFVSKVAEVDLWMSNHVLVEVVWSLVSFPDRFGAEVVRDRINAFSTSFLLSFGVADKDVNCDL